VEEPLTTGQVTSPLGAVMSEQAARTTEATIATAVKRLRRVIGVSPEEKWGSVGKVIGPNVCILTNAEMAFSYQKMSVFYQKGSFFYQNPSR
jgi:hypothetical protein